jgi:hypothetical protein
MRARFKPLVAAAAALRANTRRVKDVLANDIGAGGGRFIDREACSAPAITVELHKLNPFDP